MHFTGFVPHAQVPAVLQHVDLLVLPSLYEDLSSALIEAIAAGRPVVATRVGGTADLVRHGVNGLLVARDPAALAAAISQILTDPVAAARMPAAARHTAAGYAWPGLARQVMKVYQHVTTPPQPRNGPHQASRTPALPADRPPPCPPGIDAASSKPGPAAPLITDTLPVCTDQVHYTGSALAAFDFYAPPITDSRHHQVT